MRPKVYFNPLAPCGARRCSQSRCPCALYFNPLAPCGARLFCTPAMALSNSTTSIHLLRVEQDSPARYMSCEPTDFNPLAPCGARLFAASASGRRALLQSTCSVRSKTTYAMAIIKRCLLQSTCSVRSKTKKALVQVLFVVISIHLLRAEQDGQGRRKVRFMGISIHLLRAEQDHNDTKKIQKWGYFNPLAPCGARHFPEIKVAPREGFQSTCSVRSKTRRGGG